MPRPALMWVDLKVQSSKKDYCAEVSRAFQLHYVRKPQEIQAVIAKASPVGACFEYDEPGPEQLEPLKRTRFEEPGLPVLMLTVKHSEELAVWALRMRVWDYAVLPMNGVELAARIALLVKAKAKNGLGQDIPRHSSYADRLPGSLGLEKTEGTRKLLPAISYIEENYSEKVDLEVVARLCGLGRFQFSRFFKRMHGTTFREFLIIHRINKATQLLGTPGASITNVAFSVGFNDLSHFAQMFRRYVGMCPSEYLHEMRLSGP